MHTSFSAECRSGYDLYNITVRTYIIYGRMRTYYYYDDLKTDLGYRSQTRETPPYCSFADVRPLFGRGEEMNGASSKFNRNRNQKYYTILFHETIIIMPDALKWILRVLFEITAHRISFSFLNRIGQHVRC